MIEEPRWPTPEAAAIGDFSPAAEAKVIEVRWLRSDEEATVHIQVGPGYDYHVNVQRQPGGWVETDRHN